VLECKYVRVEGSDGGEQEALSSSDVRGALRFCAIISEGLGDNTVDHQLAAWNRNR